VSDTDTVESFEFKMSRTSMKNEAARKLYRDPTCIPEDLAMLRDLVKPSLDLVGHISLQWDAHKAFLPNNEKHRR